MEKDDKIALRIGNKAHNFPKNRIKPENKLYFSKFKKNLDPMVNNNYAESNIPEGIKVELEHVIKGYLLLLREEILDNNERIKETSIKDIKWIITVPPLWDEKGKKFMKQVAIKAGMINTEIALEPEAASLTIFHDKSIKKKFLEKGKTFLLVDAGGYTVDISANRILDSNHNLEQLLKPTSYKFGSNLINEKIIEVIEAVYGKGKIQNVKEKNYQDWEITLDEIEKKKKEIDSNTAENFRLSIKFNDKKCSYMSDNCETKFNGITIHIQVLI
jgi:molecular chaperone DnaK (HSP70)